MPLDGQLLGHYRLQRLIGRGGMGEVYLAEDTRLSRQLAVKVVQTEPTSYPDEQATKNSTRLFQREMKAIAALDHPHVLPLYDFGEMTMDKLLIAYMVMPYRPEGSLDDWIRQRGTSERLSPEEVSYFVSQAADALQHAHDHNLIHQDVKPSNFLIRNSTRKTARPDIFLTDFGVAKFTTATATASQSVRGTPAYMAPEQWDGQPVAATDQYALAIMAYFLLAGRPPFTGRMEYVMRQHFNVTPQPPSTYNLKVSPAIDAVILHALEKKPENRFSIILDFATAFEQALHYQDLRTTLHITSDEARTGTRRTITLPDARTLSVDVPANTQNGQTIRLKGRGNPYCEGGPSGPLLVTVDIEPVKSLEEPVLVSTSTEQPEPTFHISRQDNTAIAPANKIRPQERISERAVSSNNEIPDAVYIPNSVKVSHSIRVMALVIIGIVLLVLFAGLGGFTFYQIYLYQVNNSYPTYMPAAANGKLVFADSLSQEGVWSASIGSNGNECQFTDNAYLVNEQTPSSFFDCYEKQDTFTDSAFEVRMTIVQGDCGGILFRGDYSTNKYYYFQVCQDGSYQLSKYIDNNASDSTNLAQGTATTFNTGPGKSNTLAVLASGSSITLYVNSNQIAHVTDSTYSQGQLALFAGDFGNPTEVSFSNARAWTLS